MNGMEKVDFVHLTQEVRNFTLSTITGNRSADDEKIMSDED
jgi:hypothetical protein